MELKYATTCPATEGGQILPLSRVQSDSIFSHNLPVWTTWLFSMVLGLIRVLGSALGCLLELKL